MSALLNYEMTTRLSRQGNSTGLVLPRDTLLATGLARGDSVTLTVDRTAGTITVRKADDAYGRAMEAGRLVAARYRRTLAALAK
jgi:antitoxin component of MazEF toxin-antitoxin module